MKRSIKSLILLAVLVVLIGSYGLINKMNQQAEVAEEAGTFAMTEHAADELTGMIWTSGETQNHFVKNEEGWANADNATFPADQEAVQEVADRLTSMEATRKLTDVEKLEDYGFAEDSYTVTAEWSDGTTTSYIMGDETPFADGWYTRIDGEENVVYTMTSSLSAMFAETLTDLAQMEEIGNVETAQTFTMGDQLNLVYYAESTGIDSDQHWYSADGEPMDDTAVEELISSIEALEWDMLLEVNASEDQLAEYQLSDETALAITVTGDDEDAIELLIGTTDADGAYYARLPGSGMVYTMSAESVEAIIGNSEDVLWNTAIFPLEYESVQQFSCSLNGEEQVFQHAEAGEEESDAEEADPSEELWNQISALYATNRVDAEASGEELLKISVTSIAGISMDCSIHSYDVDSYHITTSEGRSLLVSADDVDKLIRTLKQ